MKNNFLKSTPIFLAFLVMGFGDVAGPLSSQLKEDFELSGLGASLVPMMGLLMFGILSIPMSLYQDRKGRKHVMVLGLITALVGMALPMISKYESFILILGGLLLMGAGATMLQVAGNPIMRDVSPEGKYSRNLSFAQFVKAIGTLSTTLIPIMANRLWDLDWKLLFPVYGVVMLIVIISLFVTKIEEDNVEKEKPATLGSSFKLLGNKYILLMVLGIFFYVGSEVCMSTNLPHLFKLKFDYNINDGLFGTLFFFLSLMTGRFLGGVILNWLSPKRFLVITSIISLVGIAGLYVLPGQVLTFVTIFLIGLGFANIFPLIFSITVDAMPERANEISGLMVTAIIGGALIPVVFGAVTDMFSDASAGMSLSGLMVGFIVPVLCIAYILITAIKPAKV